MSTPPRRARIVAISVYNGGGLSHMGSRMPRSRATKCGDAMSKSLGETLRAAHVTRSNGAVERRLHRSARFYVAFTHAAGGAGELAFCALKQKMTCCTMWPFENLRRKGVVGFRKFQSIQALRALAALGVVAFHNLNGNVLAYGSDSGSLLAACFCVSANIGVDVFSGYLGFIMVFVTDEQPPRFRFGQIIHRRAHRPDRSALLAADRPFHSAACYYLGCVWQCELQRMERAEPSYFSVAQLPL